MGQETNPRKVGRTGDNHVIYLPDGWMNENGIEYGQRYVLESTSYGFRARQVEYQPVETTDNE